MHKWEYLEFYPYPTAIRCSRTKISTMADSIRKLFPKSKLKIDDAIRIEGVENIDLMDFLGNEGWELIVGYSSGGGMSNSVIRLFKRSLSG